MVSPCGDEIVMMNSVYKERFPKVKIQHMENEFLKLIWGRGKCHDIYISLKLFTGYMYMILSPVTFVKHHDHFVWMPFSGHSADGGKAEEVFRAEQAGGSGLWCHHTLPSPPGDGACSWLSAKVTGQTNHRNLLLRTLREIREIADRCKWFSQCSLF